MVFLRMAGDGRSGLSLRIAAAATMLFGLLVVLFNLAPAVWRDRLLVAFAACALVFHIGLGIALWARFGDPAKRGPHASVAILANLVPVALFWLFVYAIVQAFRCFDSC